LELLAQGWTYNAIFKNYLQLTQKDIYAALNYAKKLVKEERVFPLKAKR